MIAPINGRFGNMDAKQMCLLAKSLTPHILIPFHFGMFGEHNGKIEDFSRYTYLLRKDTIPIEIKIGDGFVYSPRF